MKLKEIMTNDVEVIHPNDTLQTAARKMHDRDIGFLPVCDGDRLIGVLTDRDLITRALAEGMESKAMLGRDLVTSPAIYCFDDQSIDEAAKLMHDNQIRRLVILSRDKRMVGVVSLGDLAMNTDDKLSGEVLQSVSEPLSASRPEPG
ncbi:MAG TPA: CBS domain-containing protein [Anaerolineales bacterium]|jgi:CBS domain-containing protein|nr:CBS domain-containing protein [Anaerolineales bacterium]